MAETPDKTQTEEKKKSSSKGGCLRFLLYAWLVFFLLGLLANGMVPQLGNGNKRATEAFTFERTKKFFAAPVYVSVMMSGGLLLPVGILAGAAVAPLGFICDLLAVPVNLTDIYLYKNNPPLTYLVETGDNERLKERLEAGANPNAYSRTKYGNEGWPLQYAITSRNWEGFELLLAHGAVMDYGLAGNMKSHHSVCAGEDILPYYKRLYETFPDYPYMANPPYPDEMIMMYCLHYYVKQASENPIVDEMLQIMLKHHFNPNGDATMIWQRSKTALDYLIFETPTMAAERRERLVALMRQHGALRYPELAASGAPKLPPLPIDVEYDPAFAPVVEMLKYTQSPELYKFSTAYDGAEGPVLVVDIGLKRSKAGQSIDFRQPMEEAHGLLHRPIPEDVTVDMSLDVPVFIRMVLTPSGQKTPSRLAAFPAETIPIYKAVLCEEWFTLPTCEIYIASYTRERWRQYPREYFQLRKIAANYVRPADQQDPALRHVLDEFMKLAASE